MKKKKIKVIRLPRLRLDECFGFLIKIKEATSLITLEADQPIIISYGEAVLKFDLELKNSRKNSFTPQVKEADENTDKIWDGAKKFIEGMTQFPDEETKAISKDIEDLFIKYGNLSRMPYDEKYANLEGLTQDIHILGSENIEKVGFAPWLTELDSSYAKYMFAAIGQAHEQGQRVKGITQQRREEAEEAYYDLVERINAGSVYNGEGPYIEFIDTTNALIDSRLSTLAARETRAKNKRDSEDGNIPVDPDPPIDPPIDPDLPAV